MIRQRGLEPSDRPLLKALLASLDAFSDAERAVAIELVDARLAHPESDDYRFILSFSDAPSGERLAGYLCYGRTPLTQSTYDLYWIVTSPDFARSGVARGLVASMEGEIAREGGGLVRVETGSREGHGAAVHLYDALGFSRCATVEDFYAPGDDLIIFTRRVGGAGDLEASARRRGPARDEGRGAVALDEAALYDAAFGYRDYAAQREFLLACARRFGRDVRRVLAWSCGPARHLLPFADLGVACAGVDPSEAMIAYARRIAGPRADLRFARAALDERPELPWPVDLSFVPLSSIHTLTNPAALEEHLRLAAELLQPGGLHVIEATHPADLTPSGVHHTEWTEVRGDQVFDARFRIHIDKRTPDRIVPVTLDVVRSTGTPQSRAQGQRLRQEDRWFVPDLAGWRAVIAAVPELSLAAALGDFNVDVPFEHAAAWRLILVLKSGMKRE